MSRTVFHMRLLPHTITHMIRLPYGTGRRGYRFAPRRGRHMLEIYVHTIQKAQIAQPPIQAAVLLILFCVLNTHNITEHIQRNGRSRQLSSILPKFNHPNAVIMK